MKTETTLNRPTTEQLLTFINSYRELEKSSTRKANDIIKEVFTITSDSLQIYFHLCDSFAEKNKSFGQFFLNLEYIRIIYAVRSWGIIDPLDEQYVKNCNEDMHFEFLNEPTGVSHAIRLMILFFANRGIDSNPIPGMYLENLPTQQKMRYGNTANWGDYVLSLTNPDLFFEQLFNNYNG